VSFIRYAIFFKKVNMVDLTGFLRARIVVDNMIGGSAALQ